MHLEGNRPFPAGKRARKQRRLELLRFTPGDSFLHALDPRTKLLLLLSVSIVALLFTSPAVLACVFAFEITLAVISGTTKRFLSALTLASPLLLLVIVLDSLFTKTSGGPVWYSADIWFLHVTVTPPGILFAVAMGLRLLALAGISVLFIMTTSHDDLMRSLRGMRIPPTLSFSLGYALRSTTTLAEDTRQIMDAQRSRGLEFDRGTVIRNRDKLLALFLPATVSVLKRSRQTADAMQARGFRQGVPQSCCKVQKMGQPDYVMACILVLFVLVLLVVNRFFPA